MCYISGFLAALGSCKQDPDATLSASVEGSLSLLALASKVHRRHSYSKFIDFLPFVPLSQASMLSSTGLGDTKGSV